MSYVLTVTLNPCIDKTVTVERFTFGGLNRAVTEREDPGGKGINVSKVLTKMGAENLATGILFGDSGRKIKKELDSLKIKNDFLISDGGETRTNMKLIESASGEVTEINGVGAEVSPDLLSEFIEKYSSLLEEAAIVILAGSAPRGVPRDIYKTLTEKANRKGVKVILDADGDLLKNGIGAAPFMIKPNIHELSRLLGEELDENDLTTATKPFIGGGIGIVAVSMGKEGSTFFTEKEALRVSALPVEGGCATGAGDSMVAASAYSLMNGFELSKLARYASAAGSATASKKGTEVCDLDEIIGGAEKVSVKII